MFVDDDINAQTKIWFYRSVKVTENDGGKNIGKQNSKMY